MHLLSPAFVLCSDFAFWYLFQNLLWQLLSTFLIFFEWTLSKLWVFWQSVPLLWIESWDWTFQFSLDFGFEILMQLEFLEIMHLHFMNKKSSLSVNREKSRDLQRGSTDPSQWPLMMSNILSVSFKCLLTFSFLFADKKWSTGAEWRMKNIRNRIVFILCNILN